MILLKDFPHMLQPKSKFRILNLSLIETEKLPFNDIPTIFSKALGA